MFRLITNRADVERAFASFQRTMQRGARLHRDQWVGWRPQALQLDVRWNDERQFWCHFGSAKKRYWCDFGVQDPATTDKLSITVEINVPHQGATGRVAGAFVRGADGHSYIAHSGKIGGGRKGIGKSAFSNFCRGGNWHTVTGDGVSREMMILGRVDHPSLVDSISHFTREVARFKKAGEDDALPPSSTKGAHAETFNAEFSGTKTYPLGGSVEAECLHGVVVDELARTVEKLGLAVANDRPRDLYTRDRRFLFEVKTDISTTSLYCGIGQLSVHGAEGQSLVLVIPGAVLAKFKKALSYLGILVLEYRWKEGRPNFLNLRSLLSA